MVQEKAKQTSNKKEQRHHILARDALFRLTVLQQLKLKCTHICSHGPPDILHWHKNACLCSLGFSDKEMTEQSWQQPLSLLFQMEATSSQHPMCPFFLKPYILPSLWENFKLRDDKWIEISSMQSQK